jgi:hypothetical protein
LPEVPSAAMMPATWVPCPLPRSVLLYGPWSTGTGNVGWVPALAYSGLKSVTLWTMWSARSGWVPSQPESTTPTVTPLPVSPLSRSRCAAAAEDDSALVDVVSR